MKCLNCSREIADSVIDSGGLYCPFCGVGQPRGFDNPDMANISFCSCGQGLVGHVNFCPNCGQVLQPGAARHAQRAASSRLYKTLPVSAPHRSGYAANAMLEREPEPEPVAEARVPQWGRQPAVRHINPLLYVLLIAALALLGSGIYLAIKPMLGL